MQVFHTDKSSLHNPAVYFADGMLYPCAENQLRVNKILHALAVEEMASACVDGRYTEEEVLEAVQAIHAEDYLQFLQSAHARWVAEYREKPLAIFPDTFTGIGRTPRAGRPESIAGQ